MVKRMRQTAIVTGPAEGSVWLSPASWAWMGIMVVFATKPKEDCMEHLRCFRRLVLTIGMSRALEKTEDRRNLVDAMIVAHYGRIDVRW